MNPIDVGDAIAAALEINIRHPNYKHCVHQHVLIHAVVAAWQDWCWVHKKAGKKGSKWMPVN